MGRVLVISEDEGLARIVSWILVESQREAARCLTTDDALGELDRLQPDLILLDGALGFSNCRDADRLNSARPGAQIVSVHSHRPGAFERHPRAEAHLHKPFDARDLLALIDELAPRHARGAAASQFERRRLTS